MKKIKQPLKKVKVELIFKKKSLTFKVLLE